MNRARKRMSRSRRRPQRPPRPRKRSNTLIDRLGKTGDKYIAGLQGTLRSIWQRACEHDRIPLDSTFVVFSKGNPFIQFWDRAAQQLQEALREGIAGGYVGLKIGANGRARV